MFPRYTITRPPLQGTQVIPCR